uniref:Uncharacterized protein n=1 Tax=Peronospora matthiolae TaxID=2874970 RepID=A0AAV1U5R4_9STRA
MTASPRDLPLILAWYAEDVTRLVEKEVQEVEEVIRGIYPEAAFIEWEPDSEESEMRAVLSVQTKSSRTSEREAMTRALALLARTLERKTTGADRPGTTGTSEYMFSGGTCDMWICLCSIGVGNYG